MKVKNLTLSNFFIGQRVKCLRPSHRYGREFQIDSVRSSGIYGMSDSPYQPEELEPIDPPCYPFPLFVGTRVRYSDVKEYVSSSNNEQRGKFVGFCPDYECPFVVNGTAWTYVIEEEQHFEVKTRSHGKVEIPKSELDKLLAVCRQRGE